MIFILKKTVTVDKCVVSMGGIKMNNEVIITCAVTGSGDSNRKHPGVPVTPREIADSAILAAKAGAAVAHIHVRDLETGDACREVELYKEAARLIRERCNIKYNSRYGS